MSIAVSLQFDPENDLDEAIAYLERLRAERGGGRAAEQASTAPPASKAETADAVKLWEETDEQSLSRKLLEALSSEPELFTDLAEKPVLREAYGDVMSAASMRAVHRNLMKTENRLLEEGRIGGRVVAYDWERYDEEGAGRYFIELADLAALDSHLGR